MSSQCSAIQDFFAFRELVLGLVICESPISDPYSWGNAQGEDPAFLVYLGYNIPQEREDWISALRQFWKIDNVITSRASQRVEGFWYEIKVHGLKRYSDPTVFELDDWDISKDYGLDYLAQIVQDRLEASAYEDLMDSRLLNSG
jgi:hypothetical protein